jgi:elongation factor P
LYSITELRKDTLIDIDGEPYKVVEYQHTQMGRGGATVRIKIKSLISGNVLEKAYKNDDKIPPASIENKELSYLYSDDSNMYFMDNIGFDQFSLEKNKFSEIPLFFNEGSNIVGIFFKDNLISFNMPKNVVLIVDSTPDGDKGNSSSGATKEAILTTGIKVQVPMFVKNRDQIKIDTRNHTYIERVLG